MTAFPKAKLLAGGSIVPFATYVGSWLFLPKLGVAGPMANLAYFYYGESHEISDKILYTVYFPIYWTEMKLYGYSRYGIHWSDRKERKPLTVDDLRKLGYSDENLRDLGYTEEQLKER